MAKIVKSNKKRRHCKLSSCKRLLSVYNFSAYCHVHNYLAMERRPASASSVYHS
ncbi:MAG: hypothetical protein KBB52_08000 [Candidatus Omnitrophica bacterium]|nr:hypothetical protein [Candidatus Omnitrophota bacterium]